MREEFTRNSRIQDAVQRCVDAARNATSSANLKLPTGLRWRLLLLRLLYAITRYT